MMNKIQFLKYCFYFVLFQLLLACGGGSTPCVQDRIVTTQPQPPAPHTPFTLTTAGNGVEFKFESEYSTGNSYVPPNAPYPNYGAPGYGHFMLFGDGRYSFANEPYHEYELQGTYKVHRQMTPIKDNGNPPPRVVDDEIEICTTVPLSSTNKNDLILGTSNHIDMLLSRPFNCGHKNAPRDPYSSVQIIKVGNLSNSLNVSGTLVEVTYNSMELDFVRVIPYQGENVKYVSHSSGKIQFTGNIPANSEQAIFIEFTPKCTRCRPNFNKTSLTVDLFEDNAGTVLQSTTRHYPLKSCGPFDPNWLEIDGEVCFSNDQYQLRQMDAYFFFESQNFLDDPFVRVEINVDPLKAHLLRDGFNPEYQVSQGSNTTSLIFESCPDPSVVGSCKRFHSAGHPGPTNDVLGHVNFELMLKPINPDEIVNFSIVSLFENVPPDTSYFQVKIKDCTLDPKYYISPPINSSGAGGVIISNGNNPNATQVFPSNDRDPIFVFEK